MSEGGAGPVTADGSWAVGGCGAEVREIGAQERGAAHPMTTSCGVLMSCTITIRRALLPACCAACMTGRPSLSCARSSPERKILGGPSSYLDNLPWWSWGSSSDEAAARPAKDANPSTVAACIFFIAELRLILE